MKTIKSVIKSSSIVTPVRYNIKNTYELELLLEAAQQELESSYVYEKEFHSLHESESVIREEIEEVEEELSRVRTSFEQLHTAMRNDAVDSYVESLCYLRQHAWDLVHEAVQVVAMANKSIDSFEDEAIQKLNQTREESLYG